MKTLLSSLKERCNRSLPSSVSSTSLSSVSSPVKLSSCKHSSSSGIRNGSFVIRNGTGFTLVELMIVIAIIGVLAASLFPMMSNYLDRAKISGQLVNLGKMKGAIETYQMDQGEYPKTGGGWRNAYGCYGSIPSESTPNGWIPGLVDGGYIDKLPDSQMASSLSYASGGDCMDGGQFYLYKSNGVDMKLLSHGRRSAIFIKGDRLSMIDPARDGGIQASLLETGSTFDPWAYGYWSSGAVAW